MYEPSWFPYYWEENLASQLCCAKKVNADSALHNLGPYSPLMMVSTFLLFGRNYKWTKNINKLEFYFIETLSFQL